MHLALVNNIRVSAEPGLKGTCPGCSQPVTAKCGAQRIWHWAHRGKRTCDPWWETETEWHRNWKNKFPSEWQEYRQRDQSSGEWHIADVRTNHGLAVEFQHSHLNPQERTMREQFYRNMVWVIDGTRLKRDFPRFEKAIDSFKGINEGTPFLMPFPEECFPASWLGSHVPVVFDFQTETESPDKMRELLWWLLPGRVGGNAVVQSMSRQDFVKIISSHPNLLQDVYRVVNTFMARIQQQRARSATRINGDILQLLNQQLTRRPQWRKRRSRRF